MALPSPDRLSGSGEFSPMDFAPAVRFGRHEQTLLEALGRPVRRLVVMTYGVLAPSEVEDVAIDTDTPGIAAITSRCSAKG
jgi:hypothetical protein